MHLRKTLILLGSGMRCLSQHYSKRKVLGRDWIIIEGSVIVMILQLIHAKVLKNRIAEVLEADMSKFQRGGAKGKSITDNLFILRGAIDHAMY